MRPKIRQLRATYRITTPMFLGDADQQAPRHIRPPSVRGALRWWWRASMWPEIRRKASDDVAALHALHQQEGLLWGAASKRVDGEEVGGQGVILRVRMLTPVATTERLRGAPGQKYLLGQGLGLRTAIPKDSSFEVRLIWRPCPDGDIGPSLERALWLWGVLGGLGSRARRGLGSVALASLTSASLTVPRNPDELRTTLHQLLNSLPNGEPPFSAFSSQTRIHCHAPGGIDGWSLLNQVGEEMQRYRSWGVRNAHTQQHEVNGKRALQKFPEDHHEMEAATRGIRPRRIPARSIFGLPHNYFFSSTNKKVDITPAEKTRERRASPLLIHIHRFPDGSHAAIHTLFQARFLPARDAVRGVDPNIRNPVRRERFTLPPRADWQVIHNYLDRFEGQELLP